MSATTLQATDPQSRTATQNPRGPAVHPAVLAIASALLLWFSFPPADWGWLAWVALAPLFLLVLSDRPAWVIYGSAWLGGAVFWVLSIQWIRLTDPTAWFAWLVMAFAISLWWPGFLALARLAVRRLKLPMMLGVPVVWVGLEFTRAYVLTGFPWYYLAHSQYQFLPLIQIADFAGALGVSFLVAMANACWAELWARRPAAQARAVSAGMNTGPIMRIGTLGVLMVLAFGYGAFRISTAGFRPGLRVALLQSNLKQEYKHKRDPEAIVAQYHGLVAQAVRSEPPPELIVWPETSYPYGFVALDPNLDPAEFERQVKSFDPKATVDIWLLKLKLVSEQLHEWVDQSGVPMLIGSLYYDFQRTGFSQFNSAILLEPGSREVQSYHKLHLVPFGEYVPLVKTCPWLVALTPYRGSSHVPGLTFGREPRWLNFRNLRIATAICFEDTVPQLVRSFFRDVPDGHQPDILLNLSNDGWFQWSEELDMHLAVSVFRCVENRVPLARAVNTGISALVDGNGRILQRLPKNTEAVLAGMVPLDDRTSLYTAWGDWLGQLCLLGCVALVPWRLGQMLVDRLRRAP